MQHGPPINQDLLIFLAVAAVIVPLFARLQISAVLGFLAAGVMLGPFGLAALARHYPYFAAVTFNDPDQIAALGDFGVAFLLFMIGLELSWERLLRIRKLVFALGPAQVLLSAAAIGSIAFALGTGIRAAAILGCALAMSSTAIVLPSLAERRRLNSAAGRASFAVLLFQDLAVAPLLVMLSLLSARHGAGLAALAALATSVIVLGVLAIAGRVILRPLFALVAHTKSQELFVAASLLVVLGAAAAAAASGQTMALGAFIAGLLLAETEYRRQVELTIAPFQGLLLGLFFISVGARLELSQIAAHPLLLLGLSIGLIVLKIAVLFPIARLAGLPRSVAAQTAAILAPSGEFALVLTGAALAARAVPPGAGASAMIAATLSMFAIPVLVRGSERMTGRSGDEAALAALLPQGDDAVPRVIIAGFGRVGELVSQMLLRHDVPFLALDGNASVVTAARQRGAPVFYGDAGQIELLRLCGIAHAKALVVTMDNAAACDAVIEAARAERPDLVIVARARDAEHAARLYALGVSDAVPETIESSLQLSEAVLVDIGVPMGPVIASIHEKRDEFRKLLQAPSHLPRVRRAVRPSTRKGE